MKKALGKRSIVPIFIVLAVALTGFALYMAVLLPSDDTGIAEVTSMVLEGGTASDGRMNVADKSSYRLLFGDQIGLTKEDTKIYAGFDIDLNFTSADIGKTYLLQYVVRYTKGKYDFENEENNEGKYIDYYATIESEDKGKFVEPFTYVTFDKYKITEGCDFSVFVPIKFEYRVIDGVSTKPSSADALNQMYLDLAKDNFSIEFFLDPAPEE